MSAVNQLLSKAMSTSSEEEAMSCLRMARKKSKTFDIEVSTSGEFNGHSAQYWYDKAVTYYNAAKKKQEDPGLTLEQQKRLYKMYEEAERASTALYEKHEKLKIENSTLRTKLGAETNKYMEGLGFGFLIGSVIAFMVGVLIL
jgi:hypothetical protein